LWKGVKVRLAIPANRLGFLFRHQARGTDERGVAHRHRELELNVALSGQASLLIQDRRFPLFERSLVWLFPEHEHTPFEQTEDFSMLVAVFRSNLIESTGDSSRSPRGGRAILPPRRLSTANFESLKNIWTPLLPGGTPPYFNAGLTWLYHEARRSYAEGEEISLPGRVNPAVERAAVWLRHHPETDNLAELARRVGVSSPWLSRLFKEQMGISLLQFRNEQRLQQFRAQYGTGSRRTLSEAAYASGFNSYTQFFRTYRRAFGSKPSSAKAP
jgi:AraC-like DNA-binding protein